MLPSCLSRSSFVSGSNVVFSLKMLPNAVMCNLKLYAFYQPIHLEFRIEILNCVQRNPLTTPRVFHHIRNRERCETNVLVTYDTFCYEQSLLRLYI